MKNVRTMESFVGWRILIVYCLFLPPITVVAEPTSEPTRRDLGGCELVLEGRHIEWLRLEHETGKIVTINASPQIPPGRYTERGVEHERISLGPHSRVTLPPGRYRILDIEVAGGYSANLAHARSPDYLELSQNGPCRPNIGPPLTPSVQVKRLGDSLLLDPILLDIDGRVYTKRTFSKEDRAGPPQFAIYQADSCVGSVSVVEAWRAVCWRVPSGVEGPLGIVASIDTGSLGPRNGPPVSFHWRWWNHFPSLPLWILLLLILLVVSARNFGLQPSLMILPVILPLVLCKTLATLRPFVSSPEFVVWINYIVVSGTLAWGLVWLLGHWLAIGNRAVTLILILAVMSLIGFFSYYCYFSDTEGLVGSLYAYVNLVLVVPSGMMLASRLCCRQDYSQYVFFSRLVASNAMVIAGFVLIYFVFVCINAGSEGGMVVFAFLVMGLPLAILWGVFVYLVSLSFWTLAILSPFHRNRFETLFYIRSPHRSENGCDAT